MNSRSGRPLRILSLVALLVTAAAGAGFSSTSTQPMFAEIHRLEPAAERGAGFALAVAADDWPDWRGPRRDGTSTATGLPESWSPDGENLAWKAPYGALSTPVVFGDRLYLQNAAGAGATTQERIVALNADTGELVWEHRFNVTLSDAPPHRVGWASPVVDPETGNIYALGIAGTLFGLTPDGELLWQHYLSEVFGLVSTHGGRTVSPVIDQGNVIISGVTAGWGSMARGMHRFLAFDKATGQVAWVSSTGTQPYDTTYAPPIVVNVGGSRLLIAGGSDGAIHALKPSTGEIVWRFPMSKRGINTGVLLYGDRALISHGEENLADSRMGFLASIDATGSGELGGDAVDWSVFEHLGGYSSPVLDGERLYQIDNSANLVAFDAASGGTLWRQNLGTIQRASPVLADGKLYAGTRNGVFYILRPSADGVEILDRDELASTAIAPGNGDTEGEEFEPIIASVAIARGRIYMASESNIYAIGPVVAPASASGTAVPSESAGAPMGVPAHVQIYPQELVLESGEEVHFEARLFDAGGHRLPGSSAVVEWGVQGGLGTIGADGTFVASADPVRRGGAVTARVGDSLSNSARLRVSPPPPWRYDFDDMESVPPYWISALGKFQPDPQAGVLIKTNANPFLKRTRVYLGSSDLHDYTVQVDFNTATERRRLGDAGVIAQRYALIAFGTKQRLELQSWQPETARTTSVPASIRSGTWYTLKVNTENLPDGQVRVRGKIWPRDEAEPDEWTIDATDAMGSRYGSPGFYGDAHAVISFDNLEVVPNP